MDIARTTTLIPAAALESHIGILGKTGSGKSNLAKVLAEKLMAAGERVCAIDPTGTWWGLRLAADGKRSSQFSPVIFGGDHGDIPIGEQHGALLAEAVGTSADSAVIDTQQMTVGQRTRFFAAFAETLLRSNRGPLHLIIDEAHVFAPQGKVNDPQSGAMLHAANNLVSLGRGRGLRIMLISQRPAKLHKDSLTQVETLIAMRLIAPQDRSAVKDWVGEWADPAKGREIIESLPSLPRGDAWVWSPQIDYLERTHFPLAATYDSGTAEANASAKALPAIDLAKIGAKMDTIRQEALANDPKRLKARIAELEKAKPANVDPKAIEAAEARGYERGRAEGAAEGIAKARAELSQKVAAALAIEVAVAAPAPVVRAAKVAAAPVQREAPVRSAPTASDSPELTPALQRCLDALAWWQAAGFPEVSRNRAAIICGLSPTASTFGVYVSKLQKLEMVELGDAPGTIRLTTLGTGAATFPESVNGADILARARGLLKPQASRVLEIVAQAHPGSVRRDELADAMGLSRTASTLGVYLSESSKLGFIEVAGAGSVRAADWLFA